MNGTKNMTLEQGLDFANHAGLSDLERDYFLGLLQWDRAGNPRAKAYFKNRLKTMKAESLVLKKRLPPSTELTEEAKALFYSDWFYSAVRLSTSIPEMQNVDAIAERLKVSRSVVTKVLGFLIQHHLVIEKDGRYQMGTQSTHVGAGELLSRRHHLNWRLKAIESIDQSEDSLHFTSPLSLSKNDLEAVRKILTRAIDQTFDVVDPSLSEELFCLCVDWFKI